MIPTDFNFQPTLTSKNLVLRPLVKSDYPELFDCANDELLWAGHPAKDRYKEDVFAKMFNEGLSSNTCLVISEAESTKLIGWTRYYVAEDGPNDISIGFTFLTREHWGGSTNRQLKSLMLNHAFEYFDNVWFHIAPTNIRSQKATKKLGAKLINEALLFLAGKESLWQSYKLTKQQWQLT